jgi:hypothetical protein
LARKRIIGASRLKRKLKRMPQEVTEELRTVIKTEANKVLAGIQAKTPIGEGPRHLRDAWEVRISKDGLLARIGIMGKKNQNLFFYARFLEFGFRHRGGKFIRKPMVKPTWSQRRDQTRRAVKQATLRALRRVADLKLPDV